MEEILPIAARHGLPVIEDGAQSIGARRKIDGTWRMSGELGTVGTLSFFPTKNLGAWGDAGLMVTQDDALAERLRRLRLHGGSRQYLHEEVGTNSRLDTLQAAVLLAKLPYLPRWNEARAAQRRPLHRRVQRATRRSVPRARTRPTTTSSTSTRIQVPQRDELQAHLKAQRDRPRGLLSAGAAPAALLCAPGLPPRAAFRLTEAAMDSVLSLPIYPELTPGAAGRGYRGRSIILRVSRRP